MNSKTERFELRLDQETLERIDNWRRDQPDMPSRSEAVRRLVTTGLEHPESMQLYQLARFQILCAAKTKGVGESMSDSYVYAWESGVYPLFDGDSEMVRPFAQHFSIPPQRIEELSRFLDGLWIDKKTISFYKLETHYEVRNERGFWDRCKLIDACRYMRLKQLFDDDFWAGILEKSNYPTEASAINSPFSRNCDVSFN